MNTTILPRPGEYQANKAALLAAARKEGTRIKRRRQYCEEHGIPYSDPQVRTRKQPPANKPQRQYSTPTIPAALAGGFSFKP